MHYKLLLIGCLLGSMGFGLQPAQAATTISGSIIANTTWDAAGSPYTITGDTTLFPGYTLTIEPGVEVDITPGVDTEIRGLLAINGTTELPVIFTSTDVTTKWNGLYINTNQGGAIQAEYLRLSNATDGINIACCHSGGPLEIADSEFTNNTRAVSGYAGSIIMYIERTVFEGNTYAVTAADKEITDSDFRNNTYGLYGTERINVSESTFTDNGTAVYGGRGNLECSTLTSNGTALQAFFEGMTVSYSTITDNDIGNVLPTSFSSPSFQQNNIYGNTVNIQNSGANTLDATENWWNTTDIAMIEATITDGYDDAHLGLVDIEPILTATVDVSSVCDIAEVDVTAPAEVTLGLVQKDPWNKTITLNWTNSTDTDFDHIQITRTDIDGNEVIVTETETGTSYLDTSINYGMTYTYALSTVDTTGNVSAGVITDAKKVRSPHVHHLRLSTRGNALTARWERLPLRLNPAVGYIVYYGTAPDALTNAIDVGNSRMVTIPDLVRGQLYYVAVSAYNGDGVEGPMSIIESVRL